MKSFEKGYKFPYIIIKDVQPSQLEALLNYMYKGEVNVPQEALPQLIKAAEALRIRGLAVPDEENLMFSSPKKRLNNSSLKSCNKKFKKLNHESNKKLSKDGSDSSTENNHDSSNPDMVINNSYCLTINNDFTL